MYLGLLDRLAEMDFDLGQIEGNLDELQVALYDLHAELQRLATDVHAFLEAAKRRRPLIEAINGFLGFRERTGADLTLEDFRDAGDGVLQLGQRSRQGRAAGRAGGSQLHRRRRRWPRSRRFPLATNINYLRRVPRRAARARRRCRRPGWPIPSTGSSPGRRTRSCTRSRPHGPVSATRVQALIGGRRGARHQPVADRRCSTCSAVSRSATSLRSMRCRRRSRTSRPSSGAIPTRAAAPASTCWAASTRCPATHPLDAELDRAAGAAAAGAFDGVPRRASRCRPASASFDYSALRPLLIAQQPRSGPLIPGVAAGLAELTDLRLGALGRAGRDHRTRAERPGHLPAELLGQHQLRQHPALPARLHHDPPRP